MKTRSSMMMLLVCLFVAGCGDKEPTEADYVMSSVGRIGDAKYSPELLSNMFVEGATPGKDWCKSAERYMIIPKEAEVSGTTATVTVELEENATGNITGSQQWTCEKVSDEWLIKSAPLE